MATLDIDVTEATRMQRAFVALALCGDNVTRAAEECGTPATTIRRWRDGDRAAYDAVRRDLAPRLEAVVIAEQYSFVIEAGRVKRLLLEATQAALEAGDLPARDIPGALRNVATAEAIAIDKVLALSGRPTAIVEHRSAAELVRRLAKLGAVVDGSAVEISSKSDD